MIYPEKTVLLKDGSECLLRSPDAEDAPAMTEYLVLASAETHFMARQPEEIDADISREREYLRKLRGDGAGMMIGAFIGGELAGNCSFAAVRELKKLRHRAAFGIAVKSAFWGWGIGGLLLDESVTQAGAMGFYQLELGVYADNERARALYLKHGFEEWGVTKNAYLLPDGEYIDEILMGRVLR